MLCNKCDNRERCIELCEDAEDYVNQDYISQISGSVQYKEGIDYNIIEALDMGEKITTDSEEIIIYEYFIKGGKNRKTQTQIAEMLSITQQRVSMVVKKYRKILRDNLKK